MPKWQIISRRSRNRYPMEKIDRLFGSNHSPSCKIFFKFYNITFFFREKRSQLNRRINCAEKHASSIICCIRSLFHIFHLRFVAFLYRYYTIFFKKQDWLNFEHTHLKIFSSRNLQRDIKSPKT